MHNAKLISAKHFTQISAKFQWIFNTVAAEGCSPPQKLENAARRAAIFLVIILIQLSKQRSVLTCACLLFSCASLASVFFSAIPSLIAFKRSERTSSSRAMGAGFFNWERLLAKIQRHWMSGTVESNPWFSKFGRIEGFFFESAAPTQFLRWNKNKTSFENLIA